MRASRAKVAALQDTATFGLLVFVKTLAPDMFPIRNWFVLLIPFGWLLMGYLLWRQELKGAPEQIDYLW